MNVLTIPISSISGDGYEIEECTPVESIQPPETKAVAVETVHVSGRIDKFRDTYTFRGKVNGSYHGTCCQCLASMAVPFSVSVRWIFEHISGNTFKEITRSPDEADFLSLEMSRNYSGSEMQDTAINLAPYVWEEVVLSEPYIYVCSDTCKGVCGLCGADLNVKRCSCEQASVSQRISDNQGLSALATMFPDLAPEKDKE